LNQQRSRSHLPSFRQQLSIYVVPKATDHFTHSLITAQAGFAAAQSPGPMRLLILKILRVVHVEDQTQAAFSFGTEEILKRNRRDGNRL
jgi:hypothetical protein